MDGMTVSAHAHNQASVAARVWSGRENPGQIISQKKYNMECTSQRCWRSWKVNLGTVKRLRLATLTTCYHPWGGRKQGRRWYYQSPRDSPAGGRLDHRAAPAHWWGCVPNPWSREREKFLVFLLAPVSCSCLPWVEPNEKIVSKGVWEIYFARESQGMNLKANRQIIPMESQLTLRKYSL